MRSKQSKQNKPISTKSIGSIPKLPNINPKKSNPTQSLNISTYQDEGLITLLQEYLLKNNLYDTLQSFQKDCVKGFKNNKNTMEHLRKDLIEDFDKGDREPFFTKFTNYVPLIMRTKDPKTFKIQFYIQLYFYVYSFHPYLGKKRTIQASAKQYFIQYLQGRGAILAKQAQFLPFYALAYLPKPQQHPSFKAIFTKQWVQSLKKQFQLFIQKLYPSAKTPTIVNIYDKFIEFNLDAQRFSSVALTQPDEDYIDPLIQEQIQEIQDENYMNNLQPVLLQHDGKLNSMQGKFNTNKHQQSKVLNQKQRQQVLLLHERINDLQQEKVSLVSFIQNSKNKYQNLQNDFKQFSGSIQNTLRQSQQKWFKIAQELYNVAKDFYNASISLNSGIPLSDPTFLQKRGQKLSRYQSFVNMNAEDLLSDNVADYSLFQRPQHDVSVDISKKNPQFYQKDQRVMQIDFQKIKAVLIQPLTQSMSIQQKNEIQLQKCLILQALRWRITRMRGTFQKRQVVLSYTMNDLLGFKQSYHNSILQLLLNSQQSMIVSYTILFISALCKDYYGRTYTFNEQMIKKLLELRRKPDTNENIKGVILVIFQLQSNRKNCQTVLVDNGLIQEIVDTLDKQRDNMSSLMMEYSTALLLNLVLNKNGLARAQTIKSQILMTLINLMQMQSPSVKSFVHASLYPLLSLKSFRQKALQFGMQQNIKYLLQNNPQIQFQHQLKYVYQRLLIQNDEQQANEQQCDNDNDQINDQEIGEDHQFGIEEINSSLSGEFLLMKRFPLIGPDAIKQLNNIKQQVKVTLSRSIYYQREMTDRLSVQTPLLGRARRDGLTHNNSVYSNKSSNRILRSQKNSRIKNVATTNKNVSRQKLDTVQQNGSEAGSLKQHMNNNHQFQNNFEVNYKNQIVNNSFSDAKPPVIGDKNKNQKSNENSFKEFQKDLRKNESMLNESQKFKIQLNESRKQQNHENSLGGRISIQQKQNLQKVKPYEQNVQYRQAFQTRANLVRTPPQKQKKNN